MPRESRHYRKRSRSANSDGSSTSEGEHGSKSAKAATSKISRRNNRSSSREPPRRSARSRSRDRTTGTTSSGRRSRSRDRSERDRSSRNFKRSRSRERRRRSRSRTRRSRSRERRRSRSKQRDGGFGRSDDDDAAGKKRAAVAAAAAAAEAQLLEMKAKEEAAFASLEAFRQQSLLEKEAEQKRLELEMQKRRERIEKWRAERRKEVEPDQATEEATNDAAAAESVAKKWSLEDDEDEDFIPMQGEDDEDEDESKKPFGDDVKVKSENGTNDSNGIESSEKDQESQVAMEDGKQEKAKVKVKEEDEEEKAEKKEEDDDDVDPLDAFMQGVQEEVRQIKKAGKAGSGKVGLKSEPVPSQVPSEGKVTIVSGVAKRKDMGRKKGELMEQDQDALEYSSEGEGEDLQSAMSGLQSKQKKALKAIDHTQVDYEPFRKNFYIEVPEIAKMTAEETEAYRAEREGIRVRGKGCPKPIKTWPQCGVTKKMLDIFKRQKYEKPSPIQAQAIPVVMSGRDMIGIAKTGSGKTLAFLIPMFRHILDQPPLEDGHGPIGIILTPTRELALQIAKECRKFTKALNLVAVCVYGGTGISEQIAELKRGAEVVVCTPGRMIDMLSANNGRVTNLRRCTYIVLDEADRMFDMGFEPQVMKILDNVRPDRQTVMFSATFPRQMEALARKVLTKPIEVQVGGRSVVCKEVEQHVVVIDEEKKFLKLLELLGYYWDKGSVLVFVDKQEHADGLLRDLMKASYACMSLHGGIDQFDRDSTIGDFKSGKVNLLVATSVAARGLDVKHLILVVNYDCPNHYEDYVHRCGRTGRAGNKGYAYTFITPEQERYSSDIIRALELSGREVPDELRAVYDGYRSRQESEGKKAKGGGSGFSGKGFKFDEAEAQLANERKKFQKAALGLQDSDDDDAEDDIDQQIENMLAPKRRVKEVTAPEAAALVKGAMMAMASGATVAQQQLQQQQQQQQQSNMAGLNSEKLRLAKMAASRINIAKNLVPDTKMATQQTAEAILKGEMTNQQHSISAKTVAEQLAEKLNAKLNYQPKGEEEDKEEDAVETFKKYEEELEINDFPQQARWRVTSKEALAQISEYSEAGITVRGTFYPSGKDAKDGDRKLYLAIESTNELAVSKAKSEITRLIKEELIKLQSSNHPSNRGRYKVL